MVCPVLLERPRNVLWSLRCSPANKNNSYSREFVQYRARRDCARCIGYVCESGKKDTNTTILH
eukprot:scaffold11111_cov151-Skeletonema_dohrnii-CCMP3373.AAC.5